MYKRPPKFKNIKFKVESAVLHMNEHSMLFEARRARVVFPNGWGVSIVKIFSINYPGCFVHCCSYGSTEDLWETALFLNGDFATPESIGDKFSDFRVNGRHMDYSGTVEGHLTKSEVEEVLKYVYTFK